MGNVLRQQIEDVPGLQDVLDAITDNFDTFVRNIRYEDPENPGMFISIPRQADGGIIIPCTCGTPVPPPTAVLNGDGPFDVVQGNTVLVDYLANDNDPTGAPFAISSIAGEPIANVGDTVPVPEGEWELVAGPMLQFTLNATAPVGPLVTEYEVTDSNGNDVPATITINVLPVPTDSGFYIFDEDESTGDLPSTDASAVIAARQAAGEYFPIMDVSVDPPVPNSIIGPAVDNDGVPYNGPLPRFDTPQAWSAATSRGAVDPTTFRIDDVLGNVAIGADDIVSQFGLYDDAFSPDGVIPLSNLNNTPVVVDARNFNQVPTQDRFEYQLSVSSDQDLTPSVISPTDNTDVILTVTANTFAANSGNIQTAGGQSPEVVSARFTIIGADANPRNSVEVLNPDDHASMLDVSGTAVANLLVQNPTNQWLFEDGGQAAQGVGFIFDPANGPLIIRLNNGDNIAFRAGISQTHPAEERTLHGAVLSRHAIDRNSLSPISIPEQDFIEGQFHLGDISTRNFALVPEVSGTVPAIDRLRSVFASGVHEVLWIGDSRSTSPGGFGSNYIPRLNSNLNAGSTGLIQVGANSNGIPAGGTVMENGSWLSSVIRSGGSNVNDLTNPPGYQFYDTGSSLGVGILIHPDGSNNLSTPGQSFDLSNATLEVFARKRVSGPAELTVRITDVGPASTINFFATPDHEFVSSGLDLNGNDTEWVTYSIPVPSGITGNMQIAINGGTIGAVRVKDRNATRGISVSSFARGGLQSDQFLLEASGIGPFVAETGPFSCTVIEYGANDWQVGTVDEFEAGMRSLVDAFRVFHNDPNHLFALVGAYREFDPPQPEVMENMHSASHRIACTLENVAAINGMLITDPLLTQAANYADNIHANRSGQEIIADAYTNILLNL